MRINTNVSAINAWRNLTQTDFAMSKSLERLSSGFRINRAADDAAGLAISEKLRGQARGIRQAIRNSQDAISLIQTAEGALNETESILQRMRELADQAANDSLTDDDRNQIQEEIDALKSEIDRIATSTQFNTKYLLKGTLKTTLDSASNLKQGEKLTTSGVVVSEIDVSGATANTTYNITANTTTGTVTLTNATTNVAQTLSLSDMTTTSASTQVLNFSELGVNITLSGYDAANGAKTQLAADLAAQTSLETYSVGGSATFQVGANNGQSITLGIDDMQAAALGVNNLSLTSQANASSALDTIDSAINKVSTQRAKLGAVQNRLEHTIANLGVAAENMEAADSRIRDVDMALEMVAFTKNQILVQAGTAMMAQANQLPQAVLQLLR